MKKTLATILTAGSVFIGLGAITATDADAAVALNSHYPSNTITYQYDGAVSSRTRTAFDRAIQQYNATGIVKLVPSVNAQLKLSEKHLGDNGNAGKGKINTGVNGIQSSSAFINIDTFWENEGDMLNTTAMHELGHALGFGHDNQSGSFMSKDANSTRIATFTTATSTALRNLYGNVKPSTPVEKPNTPTTKPQATKKPANIVRVNYNGAGKIRLKNSKGQFKNQYVTKNSAWKVCGFGKIGVLIGEDTYLPYQYAKAIINYKPGYGINVFDANHNMIAGTNAKFKGNTTWKIFGGYMDKGVAYLSVGAGQFIPGNYTK